MLVVTSCLIQIALLAGLTESVPQTGEERIFHFCPADEKEDWSYGIFNGPLTWGKRFSGCRGEMQSPIALWNKTADKNNTLAKLALTGYDIDVSSATIENNGHSVKVTPASNDPSRSIQIHEETYFLDSLHFHWGSLFADFKPLSGSEHTMDGVRYAMELHFVHISDGGKIAVAGVMFKEGRNCNPELQKMIDEFDLVKYKDMNTTLSSSLSLEGLLPENPASYYRYEGSLTTPPGCNEGVTWSVLTKVMDVCTEQMNHFRTQLYSVKEEDASNGHCVLHNNYRNLQKRNNRPVYLSQ